MIQALRTLDPKIPHEGKLIQRIEATVIPSPAGDTHPANLPPVGFTEVTEEDIAVKSLFGKYHPDAIEFRQFPVANAAAQGTPRVPYTFLSLHLYHYWDGTGVAYSPDPYAKRIRWFRFGCVSPSHSIHRCPDCGHKADIDSSG
jgi:hypothetical protein